MKGKRKILQLIVVLFGILGFTFLQNPVIAQAREDFEISEDGTLEHYYGSETDVVIPEGVVAIGNYAFNGKSITSVVFPSTLKTIGLKAFYNCKSLERVEFNEGLETIMEQAFCECRALKEIVLPDTVSSIGKSVFMYCRSLGKVELSENLEVIPFCAFRDSGVQEIIWKTGLKEIDEWAFLDTYMTEVVFPSGLEKIGFRAFYNCRFLEKATIPASVKSLDPQAFEGCKKMTTVTVKSANTVYSSYKGVVYDKAKEILILAPAGKTSFTFPETMTIIGACAFYESTAKSITLPEGVTKIRKEAFLGSSLEEIVLPSTLRNIGDGAFSDTRISVLTLPMKVKNITPGAFSHMTCLEKFVIDPEQPYYAVYENGLYTKDMTTLLAYPGALTTTATVHKNTEVIADYAFYGCKLQGITLKKKLKTIGEYAFYASDITSITIPNSVTQIGALSFGYTWSLNEVNLSNSLTVIPRGAFFSSHVKNVSFPEGLISIEAQAFEASYINSFQFPSTLTRIGERAFDNCNFIYELTIPGNVKVIETRAFYANYGMKKLVLEEGLEEIGDDAFFSCNKLTNVVIPRSVKTLVSAFGLSNLDWIMIPESTQLENGALASCGTVYGVSGSWAEEYCTKYNRKFVAIVYPFIDVYPGNWYEKVVNYMRENKLIMGTSSVTFSPEQTMTRGQLMTILWRMEGSPKTTYQGAFTDVTAGRYCASALQWGKDNGLAAGMKDGSFHPDDGVNREQFMIFLYRYAAYKKYDMSIKGTTYTACADANKVSAYAATAVEWAYERGFIAADGKLNPQGKATRIQAAAMLMRFIEKYK